MGRGGGVRLKGERGLALIQRGLGGFMCRFTLPYLHKIPSIHELPAIPQPRISVEKVGHFHHHSINKK